MTATPRQPPDSAPTERRSGETTIEEAAPPYQILFERNRAPMFVFDADTLGILTANEAALARYGYAREEFLALKVSDLLLPDELPGFRTDLEGLDTSAAPTPRLQHHRTQSGAIFEVELLLEAMRFAGRPAVLACTTDVAERRHAARLLRESEERFRAAFDRAGIGMALVDPTGRLLEVNSRFCEMIGYAPDELRRMSFGDFTHPDDLEADLTPFHEMLGGLRDRYQMEKRYIHKTGRTIWARLTASMVRDADGHPRYALGMVEDITPWKAAGEALRASERRHRELVDQAPIGIYRSDRGGRIHVANPALARILGYDSPDELLEIDMARDLYWDPTERERLIQRYQPHLIVTGLEVRWRRKDGTPIWVELTTRRIPREPEEGPEFEGFAQDITHRKEAQEALRVSEARYRTIVRNMPNAAVFLFDHDLRYLLADGPALAKSGWTRAQIEGRTVGEVMEPDHARRLTEQFRSALAGHVQEFEIGDDEVGYYLSRVVPIRGEDGQVIAGMALALDVTATRRAAEEVREGRQRLAILSRRLLEAQETERRHIARGLHDDLGQTLTAVRLNLDALRQRVGQDDAVAAPVRDGIALVDDAIAAVRSLSLDLRPSLLDDLGLVPALRWYARSAGERSGLDITMVAPSATQRLPQPVETACFRIAQEAVTNALRHAGARRVEISLRLHGNEVELLVRDDGGGFDVAAARARASAGQSIGLLSMEERAALAGGSLRVASSPGGSTVMARFPYEPDDA